MMITSKHFFVILLVTFWVVCFVGMSEVPNNPGADGMIGSSGITCFDCYNGESFGFDTLRLKENNLRIKFQDTSSTLSLKSDGKVGIGTWSPGYPLEVEGSGSPAIVAQNTSGATVKITAGGGAGQVGTESNHNLRLMVNSSTEVMVFDTAGHVGIGVIAPTHLLYLNGGAYSDGTSWETSSSREYKENIEILIAEEVPDLMVAKERKGTSAMDVVAVLTKVVQEQQKSIQEQQKTISELNERIAEPEKKL